ncbi:MAG: hypothetical protein EBV07_01125, partial [Proteobacteria bacterium]|nr:hypothetical protein [Pseudomonadota bacterium]
MKISTSVKNILEIDLEKKTYHVRSRSDLEGILGGVGLSLKLYSEFKDEKPIIFSVGPLNGFFPFASKTSVMFGVKNKIYDYYIGGSLSTRIRFANIDAIVLLGRSKSEVFVEIQNQEVTFLDYGVDFDSHGLPGKRSIVEFKTNKYLLDNYFRFSGSEADSILHFKKVLGIVISGSFDFNIPSPEEYDELYKQILQKYQRLSVDKGEFPSCSGCPMGCSKSNIGEKGGSLLAHSLVGCNFASTLFNNHDLIISCLNVLGYKYTHEDIEKYLQT